MIKLKDIIQELDKPSNIYAAGQSAERDTNDDMMKKGFQLGKPTIFSYQFNTKIRSNRYW